MPLQLKTYPGCGTASTSAPSWFSTLNIVPPRVSSWSVGRQAHDGRGDHPVAALAQPRARAVLPVRNTSAASMQSPPASADASGVIILSPVLARPGALPKSRRRSTSWGSPRCRAWVAGRISPALLTRRRSSKAMRMRSGW